MKDPDGTLLLKYVAGTIGAQERGEVEEWLARDAANEETLIRIARIYHARRTALRIAGRDPYKALRKVRKRIEGGAKRLNAYRVAAAASLLAAAAGIGLYMLPPKAVGDAPHTITVTADEGMRSKVDLPDGTAVYLNAGSTLAYPSRYDRHERRVQLTGEAYFEVAHVPEQPFTVSVRNDLLLVTVLGTAFNIQGYEGDSLVQTTLAEGSIQLGVPGKKRTITMIPAEKATYNVNTTRICLEKLDPGAESAWKDGTLIFRDTPMPEVLRRLAYFYSVEFDVRDEAIRGYTFTGTFDNRELTQILDYMKISSKINHSIAYPENREERPVVRLTRSNI